MKRIAFQASARDRCIQERQIERCVVTDQYGAPAPLCTDSAANLTKYPPQRIALIDRGAQRMPGIDPIDLQRDGIEARVLKRAHVIGMRGAAIQAATGLDLDEYGCNLQQGV